MKIKRLHAALTAFGLSVLLSVPFFCYAESTVDAAASEDVQTGQGVVTNSISGWPQAEDITATAGVVLEDSHNVILYNKNMDEPLYPASAVKIMTTLLALENSELDDEVTMTATGVSGVTDGGVSISARLDEVFTMNQCLHAIMLASANDVALQVAEHIGGSVEAFVEMMNERAKELGCTNTVFTNPTGLPDEAQHTTAHDLALIMQAAISNEAFRDISTATSYTIPATNMSGGERVLSNNLGLLNRTGATYYSGCLGGKEGSTTASGTTLVTAAERDDMTLVCVVLQGRPEDTESQAIQLLDYGFDHFTLMDLGRNDFDLISGGIVLAPMGSTAKDFTIEDEQTGEEIHRTYLFSDIPVGTAVVANPVKQDENLTNEGEENIEAAQEFTEQKSPVPYFVIGGVGALVLILLLIRMVKVAKS